MKSLFDETKIKGMACKNRFFRAATYDAMATEDGHLNDELVALYCNVAAGGVATIITGYAHVIEDEQPNPRMMGIYDDSFIDDYRALTAAVHERGANIVLQVAYGGANTSRPTSPVIWGPSAVLNPRSNIVPTAMTLDDIAILEQAFADAARRAEAAGFDGVELHAAHGYLYSAFLTPYFNRRTDAYGGSIENRARIIAETVAHMTAAVSDAFPVLVKMNCEDFMDAEGLTADDARVAARLIADAGACAIEVSGGNDSAPEVRANNRAAVRIGVGSAVPESYFADQAARMADALDVPVILTGGNRSFASMDALLNGRGIEYFGLCRPLIREPDLVNRWRVDLSYAPQCISCNGCHKGGALRCAFDR